MKVCYTGGAVKDCGSYYSVATNAVELRIWFLTDDILRIRAGFDGDWDEASYIERIKSCIPSAFGHPSSTSVRIPTSFCGTPC